MEADLSGGESGGKKKKNIYIFFFFLEKRNGRKKRIKATFHKNILANFHLSKGKIGNV
jgi:hypothetical protein